MTRTRQSQDLGRSNKQGGNGAAQAGDDVQANETTQSAASLSRSADAQTGEGRFGVAEEVNLDQQSDQARRVGRMPQDMAGATISSVNPSDAMAKAAQPEQADAKGRNDLVNSIERAVPLSEKAGQVPKK